MTRWRPVTKWHLKEDFNIATQVEATSAGEGGFHITSKAGYSLGWIHSSQLFDTEIEAIEEARKQAEDYLNLVKQRQKHLEQDCMEAYHNGDDVIDDFKIRRNMEL